MMVRVGDDGARVRALRARQWLLCNTPQAVWEFNRLAIQPTTESHCHDMSHPTYQRHLVTILVTDRTIMEKNAM